MNSAVPISHEAEIIYHVVQRSFYDSDGDLNGDFIGLREKLDYLQDLGVTSLLLLPINESPFYHNYFSSDFERADPKFGSNEDFFDLVKEVHNRGMKIYIDMEVQYVTEDHIWYKDSLDNPSSRYSDYISYEDESQKIPSSILYDLKGLNSYDGTYKQIATVNLNNQEVRNYIFKLFYYWMSPRGDNRFDEGVDGFRLDHMMDDLDNKGLWTNLLTDFWKPLIEKLKEKNPDVIFMAEQAEWSSPGLDYFSKAGVDWVFAFNIAFGIRELNRDKLISTTGTVFSQTPPDKNQVVFVENHDMPRFATVADGDGGKLRVGAALNLFIGGIPSIYYGQEIGMKGAGIPNQYGNSDANEIPEREAFEWYKSDTGKGMAFWYKETGPWWNRPVEKPNDGISVEEQAEDPDSLLSFYKRVIRIRKENARLFNGSYQNIPNDNNNVFSFLRELSGIAILVVINLGYENQIVSLTIPELFNRCAVRQLFGVGILSTDRDNFKLEVGSFAVNVFELVAGKKS